MLRRGPPVRVGLQVPGPVRGLPARARVALVRGGGDAVGLRAQARLLLGDVLRVQRPAVIGDRGGQRIGLRPSAAAREPAVRAPAPARAAQAAGAPAAVSEHQRGGAGDGGDEQHDEEDLHGLAGTRSAPGACPSAERGRHAPILRAMLIAIDGPAGAGKSTIARAVADALGFTYLDSGAMYRCVALAELRGHDDPLGCSIELGATVTLDGEDVSAAIRAPQVSELASQVAARPQVRERLVELQRAIIQTGDYVAEGRDIGTVVAPDAELKVFLTASPQERARRRAAQLGADAGQVLREQVLRDERDATRAHSPLQAAGDATQLDTTGLSIGEVTQRIVDLAKAVR